MENIKPDMTDARARALLRLSIRDACKGFQSVDDPEDAEAMITLEDLQADILKQLESTISEEEKGLVNFDFLKEELRRNKLVETLFKTEEGIREVWLLKKKPETY